MYRSGDLVWFGGYNGVLCILRVKENTLHGIVCYADAAGRPRRPFDIGNEYHIDKSEVDERVYSDTIPIREIPGTSDQSIIVCEGCGYVMSVDERVLDQVNPENMEHTRCYADKAHMFRRGI